MKLLQVIVFSFLATQANCQITEVTYDNETNDTLSVKEYNTDRAVWEIGDSTITWMWYNADSILLLKKQYSIIDSKVTEMGFKWAYSVLTEDGGNFWITLWIFEDRSKAVGHRYSDAEVRYSGNVSF